MWNQRLESAEFGFSICHTHSRLPSSHFNSFFVLPFLEFLYLSELIFVHHPNTPLSSGLVLLLARLFPLSVFTFGRFLAKQNSRSSTRWGCGESFLKLFNVCSVRGLNVLLLHSQTLEYMDGHCALIHARPYAGTSCPTILSLSPFCKVLSVQPLNDNTSSLLPEFALCKSV